MFDEGLQFAFSKGKLFLFLVPLWIGLIFRLRSLRIKTTAKLGVGKTPRTRFSNLLYQYALPATLFLVILAWMQPFAYGDLSEQEFDPNETALLEEEKGKESKRVAHDVIFVLDTSASMDVKDTRLGISRLEFAKEIIDETIKQLNGQNVALYAFTSEVTTLVPLTVDYVFFRLRNQAAAINEGDVAGTDLLYALDVVKRKHLAKSKERPTTVILLTDGGDTRIEQLTGSRKEEEMQLLLTAVGDMRKTLSLHAIGLGTRQGLEVPGITYEGKPVISSLDEDLLEKLSLAGGGNYIHADEGSTFVIAQELAKTIRLRDGLEDFKGLSEGAAGVSLNKNHYYQIPLGIALLLLLIFLTTPQTAKKRGALLLLMFAFPLSAQEGVIDSEIAKALNLIELKQYEEAEEALRPLLSKRLSEQEEGLLIFNLATLKILQGKYSEALPLFDALSRKEDLSDILTSSWGYNAAFAYLMEIEQVEKGQLTNKELEELQKGLSYLILSAKAQEKIPGNYLTQTRIQELKSALKALYAEIQNEVFLRQYQTKELYDIVRDFSKEIKALAQGVSGDKRPLYLSKIKNLEKVFEVLRQRGKEFPGNAKSLFEESYQAYLTSIEAFEASSDTNGEDRLRASAAFLLKLRQNLLDRLWENDPTKALKESSENLREKLQNESEEISAYKEELDEVALLFAAHKMKLDPADIQSFEQVLDLSEKLFNAQEPKREAFFKSALLGSLSHLIQGASTEQTALERGIEAQKHTLELVKKAQELSYDASIDEQLQTAQDRVFEVIRPFPQEHEKKEAFEAGKLEAQKAKELLFLGGARLNEAAGHQQEAIRYWSEEGEGTGGGEEDDPKENQEQEQNRDQDDASPFDNPDTELYQALEKDDSPPKDEEGVIKKVPRPW